MSRLASHAQDYLFSYDPQGTFASVDFSRVAVNAGDNERGFYTPPNYLIRDNEQLRCKWKYLLLPHLSSLEYELR